MDYSQALEFLSSFPDMERGFQGPRGATMSLEAMRSLLHRLGTPQDGRHTVHVTGSKGKGSTSVMIASILKAAGLRTALYTSPHLHSYTERIAFDLKPVAEAQFANALAEIKPAVQAELDSGSIVSTFGVLTALFFHMCASAQPKVDWQVVEVGLGGRFDATNVFAKKDAAVITAVSLEHTEILGTNQSEIATNKAGIISPGSVVVLAPQKDPGVPSVVVRRAHAVGADFIYVPKAYKVKLMTHDFEGQRFVLEGAGQELVLHTPMLGEHQAANAATAAATARALAERGANISDADIRAGLAQSSMAGRFELFHRQPGSATAQPPHVVLDGAHNHESAAALASCLKALYPDQQWAFVIGVNRDKNINAIWRELLPQGKVVIATRSSNPRAMECDQLSESLGFQSSQSQIEVRACQTVAQALDQALCLSDCVCVTGSLYVVADARSHLLDLDFLPAQPTMVDS